MNAILRAVVRRGMGLTAAKWLLLGGLVGILCGVAGLLFYLATDVGTHFVLHVLGGYAPSTPAGEVNVFAGGQGEDQGEGPLRLWWLMVALGIGGVLSGSLVAFLAKEAEGAGTEAAVHAYHHRRGDIPLRVTVVKFFASVLTLSSGGSAGREGPIALVGAGFASWCSRRLGLSSRDRRNLLAAGIAGGVAAIFRAPLAGALFAAEVLYSDPDVEADVLIPSFISAIVGFVTFGLLEGLILPHGSPVISSLFLPPGQLDFRIADGLDLVGYMLVAIAAVMGARLLTITAERFGKGFSRLPGPSWLRPGIGGLMAGAIAIGALELAWATGLIGAGATEPLAALGAGYGILQQAMDGFGDHVTSAMILLLLVAGTKLLTTCCTVCSGGSGGMFGPSIVIGGCLGGAVGLALQGWAVAPPTAACVIMGMAGFFAATYKTPIAALLMVSEMTGNYELLLPAMWVCALAYLSSGRRGIVHSQVRSPVDSPAHRGHFFNDILAGIRVHQVFDPEHRPAEVLRPDSTIDECKQLVASSHQTVYPVVDDDGRLTGIFNLNDLREFLFDESLGLVAVAQDVATESIIEVSPRDSLATTLRRFTEKNLEELPVIDAEDGRFLGLLTRRQVIAYYNRVVDDLRAQRRAEGWAEDDSGGRPAGERPREHTSN